MFYINTFLFQDLLAIDIYRLCKYIDFFFTLSVLKKKKCIYQMNKGYFINNKVFIIKYSVLGIFEYYIFCILFIISIRILTV